MNDHSETRKIQIFEFPIFRLRNLIYSIPISLILVVGLGMLNTILESWTKAWPPLVLLFFIFFCFIAIGFFTIKTILGLSVQKARISVFQEGFKLNVGRAEKEILWQNVSCVVFPKDKFESQSKAPASKIMFSLGILKMYVITIHTWTLFNKKKRDEYNQNFEAFKAAVRQNCASKIQY